MSSVPTFGVEEELHLLDPATRRPAAAAADVLDGADVPEGAQLEHEIKQSVVETGTSVCTDADELLDDLRQLRAQLAASAAGHDLALASCGLLPTSDWRSSELVENERYEDMRALFGQVFDEQVVCGLHVHVGVDDRDLAVAVLDRIGPWLPPLLALSASSPVAEGHDTGFASFRTMVLGRWATSGLPAPLGDAATHDRLVADLVATGTIVDAGQVYWMVRLSRSYPTLEFRVADAVPTAEEAVLQAVLSRAIVTLLADDVAAGRPPRLPCSDATGPLPRPELVGAATWQAARFGTSGDLLDLARGSRRPAADLLRGLLDQLAVPLAASGDTDLATRLLERVLADGAPAQRIRAAAAKGGAKGATDLLVRETAGR